MATPVVNGAMTSCTMGLAPSTLNVLPLNRTTIQGQPMASIADAIPFTNIVPFGLCNSIANPATAALTAAALGVLTPGPCAPVPAGIWAPGAAKSTVGVMPALTNSCSCKCAYLGEIKISFGGVVNVTIA
jgi:hypothetical protein